MPNSSIDRDRQSHSSRPHICLKCGKGYKDKIALKKHLQIYRHTKEKNYECELCGKYFNTHQTLLVHITGHTGEKAYKCPVCNLEFINYQGMIKHHRRKHDRDSLKLSECIFCEKKMLPAHLNRHLNYHNNERPFHCKCGKEFPSAHFLNNHSSLHSGVKSFKCKICPKAFFHERSLQVHRRSHVDGVKVSCDKCCATFSYNKELTAHLQVHQAKNQVKCDLCGWTYKSKRNLTYHMKQMHDLHEIRRRTTKAKDLQCVFCPKKFAKPCVYSEHLLRHIHETPFECELCDMLFCTKYALTKHIRQSRRHLRRSSNLA